MIYSTDNRETWSRFDVLGWDRFLGFVKKTELKAWKLAPYRRLSRDFDPPITDLLSVPMLFRRNSEASTRMAGVIEESPAAVLTAMRDMSTRQSGTGRLLGSAFEIPFAAVEICRIALEHFMTVGPVASSPPSK